MRRRARWLRKRHLDIDRAGTADILRPRDDVTTVSLQVQMFDLQEGSSHRMSHSRTQVGVECTPGVLFLYLICDKNRRILTSRHAISLFNPPINAKVAPSQCEFQVGPCTGINAGDHLCFALELPHMSAFSAFFGVSHTRVSAGTAVSEQRGGEANTTRARSG